MVEKDKRIEAVNEVLSGIRVLKLYSWENSFEDKVNMLKIQDNKLNTSYTDTMMCTVYIHPCTKLNMMYMYMYVCTVYFLDQRFS